MDTLNILIWEGIEYDDYNKLEEIFYSILSEYDLSTEFAEVCVLRLKEIKKSDLVTKFIKENCFATKDISKYEFVDLIGENKISSFLFLWDFKEEKTKKMISYIREQDKAINKIRKDKKLSPISRVHILVKF